MTSYILPSVFVLILVSAFNKTNVYNDFISGAENGLKTVFGIFPSILAVITAFEMFNASGALEIFFNIISPITHLFKIPDDVIQLAVVRPFSAGAATGLLSNILSSCNPDSITASAAAVLCASSETTFYTLSVYFQKTRVKYTKKIIPAAVIGDIVGLLAAVWVCRIIF